MGRVTFKETPVAIWGTFPEVGAEAEDFRLVGSDLSEVGLDNYKDKSIILNIFPSIDTPVCALATRRFNEEASKLDNTVVLCISKDLPFAQSRFCEAEGLKNVVTLSAFRYRGFQQDYGVGISDGPLKELLARAVLVLNKKREVIYAELVPEITNEPDYAKCMEALKGL